MQFTNKNGKTIEILNFTEIERPDVVLVDVLLGMEKLRPDLLSKRLYADVKSIGRIVKCNEKDIFSINDGENVYYER